MSSSTLFTDAMALTPRGDGVYDGVLNEHWTIGPKVHGGSAQMLAANAAHAAFLEWTGSSAPPLIRAGAGVTLMLSSRTARSNAAFTS